MYNNLMIPCWSFSARLLKEQYNIRYACLKKVGPTCWKMCCTWILIRWCAPVVRSLWPQCNCWCRHSHWRCWATFDATKATDWTAAFVPLVEQGTHRGGFNCCRTRKVRRKVGCFVLIWSEFQACVWKKDPSHESKPWKIPTSKLQCFELPYNNNQGRQKNRTFITFYPLGYECSKLHFFPLCNNGLRPTLIEDKNENKNDNYSVICRPHRPYRQQKQKQKQKGNQNCWSPNNNLSPTKTWNRIVGEKCDNNSQS